MSEPQANPWKTYCILEVGSFQKLIESGNIPELVQFASEKARVPVAREQFNDSNSLFLKDLTLYWWCLQG